MIECKIGLDKKATVVSVFCYFTWRQCFAAFSRETLKKRGINIYDVKGKSKKRSKGRETGIRLERERVWSGRICNNMSNGGIVTPTLFHVTGGWVTTCYLYRWKMVKLSRPTHVSEQQQIIDTWSQPHKIPASFTNTCVETQNCIKTVHC